MDSSKKHKQVIQTILKKSETCRDGSGKQRAQTSKITALVPYTISYNHPYISSCKPGLLRYLLQDGCDNKNYAYTCLRTLFTTAIPTCMFLISELLYYIVHMKLMQVIKRCYFN